MLDGARMSVLTGLSDSLFFDRSLFLTVLVEWLCFFKSGQVGELFGVSGAEKRKRVGPRVMRQGA